MALLPYRHVTLDVLAAVGVLRWGLDLQRIEIRHHLERRGVYLSDGEISHLSDEFLVRFHQWFDATRPAWAPRLKRGLVLLIDGTQDAGGRVTYRAVTHRQGVTVHAASLKSENEDDVVAFLETVKTEVGVPRLILRDGSSAAKNACERVFPSVPQGLCHWHWLKNAGEALLGDAYTRLRDAVLATRQLARLEDLRRALATASVEPGDAKRRVLRVWVRLQAEDVLGRRDSVGGFPFRLAYLDVMVAVREARERVREAVKLAVAWNVCEPFLLDAKERLDALWDDAGVRSAFVSVARRASWFDQLRSWLRLEDAARGRPTEPAGAPLGGDDVARRVYGLRDEAGSAGSAEEAAWMRVVTRFEACRDELFPRVRLRDPPRTTTLIESLHREDRRSCRRRTGTLSTRGVMERVGDHLAVWSSVGNPWFARYALDGVDLVGAFQAQDPGLVRAGLARVRAKRWRDRLPVASKDRAFVLDRFLELARAEAPFAAFTTWADQVEGVG